MKIRVFTTIDDPVLKPEWERLGREANIFPQSSYEWCSTWWKYMGAGRKLHVVTVCNDRDEILSIAPLCLDSDFGVPILRSFPVNFGDFYTFISGSEIPAEDLCDLIVQYLVSNQGWKWVRLDKLLGSDPLVPCLRKYGFLEKRITGCVITDFSGLDWEDYLGKLSRKFRGNIRSRLRKIHKVFHPELRVTTKWEDYEPHFSKMVEIYENRWEDDYRPSKGTPELSCWKDAIRSQFEKGKMIYCELLFNGNPVAYRLGFVHDGTYFDWHTSYNPDYREYHPGVMILAFMIKYFMENSVSKINFMAGEYSWKLDWSIGRDVESVFMFTSQSSNICSSSLNLYHHIFRDKFKSLYHNLMRYKALRSISRHLLSFKNIYR